jgi:hypothetical protein
MAKTKTTKPTTKRAKGKPATVAADVDAAAKAEKRALQQRIRTQHEIVRLGKQLARMTRTADYQLADLGARLLDRARRAQQGDAAQDFIRETSFADRQPVIGD